MARNYRFTIGTFEAVAVVKPTAANTGATGTLTTLSGDQLITVAGTTIEDKDIYGKVTVRAANVTLRNCRIRGNATQASNSGLVDATHASVSNLLIEDCTLAASTPSVWWTGIIGHNYTARRCNISQVVDGFGVYNTSSPSAQSGVLIELNYVHDLSCISPDPNHSDGKTHNDVVQIQGGGYVVIRNNHFDATPSSTSTAGVKPTSCVMITPNVSACPGNVITGNWLYGVSAAVINVSPKSKGSSTTAWIADNRFGPTVGYPMLLDNSQLTFAGLPTTTGLDTNNGNVYDATDLPVKVYRQTV